MNKVDGQRVIEFIEGYYHIKLDTPEIKALSEELKNYTFEEFENNLKRPILNTVEFFNVAQLHKIVEEDKEEQIKKMLGIRDLDDLYEN